MHEGGSLATVSFTILSMDQSESVLAGEKAPNLVGAMDPEQ